MAGGPRGDASPDPREGAGSGPRPRIEAIAARVGGVVGVSVVGPDQGAVVSINAGEPFPAASLIKLPVMAAVFQEVAEGRLDPAEEVELTPECQVGGAGVLQALTAGRNLPIRDLVTLMIIVSDNTATNMLIDRIGVEAVNDSIRRLGLTGTRLYNKLMVVPAHPRGHNVTTPADMSALLAGLARGEVISYDASRRMVQILKKQQFDDGLPACLPPRRDGPAGGIPAWEVANKTGLLADAFHDAGLVFLPGGWFAIAVLTREVPDVRRARAAAGHICRVCFDHFSRSRTGSRESAGARTRARSAKSLQKKSGSKASSTPAG